jgi:hypothetical protein
MSECLNGCMIERMNDWSALELELTLELHLMYTMLYFSIILKIVGNTISNNGRAIINPPIIAIAKG